MYNTIIKQLEKALESKDDSELRLRVEVLLDMIKDQQPVIPQPMPQPIPQPIQTTYDDKLLTPPTVSGSSSPRVNGAGSISSINSEQIQYKRPKGT